MKLDSTEMEASYTLLASAHRDLISSRADLRLSIEGQLRAALYEKELVQARAARHCRALGASKGAIGARIGTSDWRTIQRVLDMGVEIDSTPADQVERIIESMDLRTRFYSLSFDDEAEAYVLTVMLDAESTLAAAVKSDKDWAANPDDLNVEPWASQHPEIGQAILTATENGQPTFKPIDKGLNKLMPALLSGRAHPARAWLNDPENNAHALAWALANTPAN